MRTPLSKGVNRTILLPIPRRTASSHARPPRAGMPAEFLVDGREQGGREGARAGGLRRLEVCERDHGCEDGEDEDGNTFALARGRDEGVIVLRGLGSTGGNWRRSSCKWIIGAELGDHPFAISAETPESWRWCSPHILICP